MRSGELADLAQVSIRTLRHYHQIGLLPEPQRSLNGYRDYDGRDLVRVLRIRRLAELGVRLDEIGPMLQGEDTGDSLAALDAALAAQIEQLQARRRLLATLAEAGETADLPPGLSGYLARLAETGVGSDALAAERDVAVLVAHLYGPDVVHRLLQEGEATLAGETHAAARAAFAAWAELGDEAEEEAIVRTAHLMLTVVEEARQRLGDALPRDADPRQRQGQVALQDLLTPSQQRVLEIVEHELGE